MTYFLKWTHIVIFDFKVVRSAYGHQLLFTINIAGSSSLLSSYYE